LVFFSPQKLLRQLSRSGLLFIAAAALISLKKKNCHAPRGACAAWYNKNWPLFDVLVMMTCVPLILSSCPIIPTY
jgi:hypothetical protein